MAKEFISNRHGNIIVKCCASCVHKQFDNHTRICLAGCGCVRPSFLCAQWDMNPVLDNAGNGNGNVKKPAYLRFALDSISNGENGAGGSKEAIRRMLSVYELREEYKKKYKTKTVYL